MQATEARVSALEHDDALITRMSPLAAVVTEGPAVPHLRVVPPAPVLLSPSAETAKRAFDLVVALVALIVLAPLLALIAAAIALDSRGPVLYRQRRVGRNGMFFEMTKFRTMFDGAHDLRASLSHLNEAADGLFKISADPRVTRVGRLLRRTHLDELPQLVDVLLGQMAIVGPRPLVPEEDARIPGHLRDRLTVRPGITGPWQITANHELGLSSMARLDLDYIAGWTLWRDLRVVAVTAWHVLTLRGK